MKKKKQMVVRDRSILDNWTAEQLEVIKGLVGARQLTDTEFKGYLMSCKELNANPLKKEIVPVIFKDKYGNRNLTLITTIDFFRRKTAENPKFNGMTQVEYGDMIKVTVDKKSINVPEWAEIGIYLKGSDKPTIARAYFTEHLPAGERNQFQWAKMPRLMIANRAEVLAHRRATPALSKIYDEEEAVIIKETSTPEPKKIELEKASPKLIEELQGKSLQVFGKKVGDYLDKVCKKAGIKKLEEIDKPRAEMLIDFLNNKLKNKLK